MENILRPGYHVQDRNICFQIFGLGGFWELVFEVTYPFRITAHGQLDSKPILITFCFEQKLKNDGSNLLVESISCGLEPIMEREKSMVDCIDFDLIPFKNFAIYEGWPMESSDICLYA